MMKAIRKIVMRWINVFPRRTSPSLFSRNEFYIECRDVAMCAVSESCHLSIHRFTLTDRWERHEGARHIHDFVDPVSGSIADNLVHFFFRDHGLGGCHFCHRFYNSRNGPSCLPTLGVETTPMIQQYAQLTDTTQGMWTVRTGGTRSEELRVLAGMITWLAMGHTVLASHAVYPDVYGQFQKRLRCPDRASPLDLLHFVARTIGEQRMCQCMDMAIQWMHRLGCVTFEPGTTHLTNGYCLGVEHPTTTTIHESPQRELLMLSCQCTRLRRYYYIPRIAQSISCATELRQCLLDLFDQSPIRGERGIVQRQAP
jgi:hypothetical protein